NPQHIKNRSLFFNTYDPYGPVTPHTHDRAINRKLHGIMDPDIEAIVLNYVDIGLHIAPYIIVNPDIGCVLTCINNLTEGVITHIPYSEYEEHRCSCKHSEYEYREGGEEQEGKRHCQEWVS